MAEVRFEQATKLYAGNDEPAVDALLQSQALEQALFEIKKVIVGQDRAIERLLVSLLARQDVTVV